jgi:hypothetical protein
MRTILAGFLAVAALGFSPALAASIVFNGDFNTGTLFPWQVTAGSVSVASEGAAGFSAASSDGTISQLLVTRPGARYYVSFEATGGGRFGSFVAVAQPAIGGDPDGVRTVSNINNLGGIVVHSFVFDASSASTALSLSIRGMDFSGATPGFVDNLVVKEVPPARFTGLYKGTYTRSLSAPAFDIAQKVSEKLVARVDADGGIIMLRDASEASVGQLFADGTFVIRFSGVIQTGTVVLNGKRIEFQFEERRDVQAEADGFVATESITRLVFTKVKG